MDYTIPGILQSRILEWVAFPFSGDHPKTGIELSSPVLQADSLPPETQGKAKNTGVGILSLLQGIFPTQESNWDLLHWRWILTNWAIREALMLGLLLGLLYGFPCTSAGKESICNVGDLGFIPGKNTGVGCYFLLQRIFPTQGSNPCLLHWQADSLPLSPLRSTLSIVFKKSVFKDWISPTYLIISNSISNSKAYAQC